MCSMTYGTVHLPHELVQCCAEWFVDVRHDVPVYCLDRMSRNCAEERAVFHTSCDGRIRGAITLYHPHDKLQQHTCMEQCIRIHRRISASDRAWRAFMTLIRAKRVHNELPNRHTVEQHMNFAKLRLLLQLLARMQCDHPHRAIYVDEQGELLLLLTITYKRDGQDYAILIDTKALREWPLLAELKELFDAGAFGVLRQRWDTECHMTFRERVWEVVA